jgi:DNA-binding XRE family transcriptional regulator
MSTSSRSASRTPIAPGEDEIAAENWLLRVVAAMERRVPSAEDRRLLLAVGRAVRERREELGMTPAELSCATGVRREELEAIEAGRPYPGHGRARRRTFKCP